MTSSGVKVRTLKTIGVLRNPFEFCPQRGG